MIPFRGRVWRMIQPGADPHLPARAPVGRFHHSGQTAIYLSLSPEGCRVAIARYLTPDAPPRPILGFDLDLTAVADQRGNAAASVVWQDGWAAGTPSPTWALSDAARAMGAEAMVYSSRSRPDLTHLVLFAPGIARLGPVAERLSPDA